MKKINKELLIGTVHSTINYGDLKITDYKGAKSVSVEFIDTGYKTIARMDAIKNGVVRDPLHKSIFNIGFVGIGEFMVSLKGKHTKEYLKWRGMMSRCYSDKVHEKQPTYIGCTV